jgi:hypothetical protein
MAVETLRLEELIDVANEERVIDGYSKVNVTDVTWAEVTVEAASDTPIVSMLLIEAGSLQRSGVEWGDSHCLVVDAVGQRLAKVVESSLVKHLFN